MKEIVWAMIGTGSVTEKKSGPGFYKSDNSKLLGVYNRTYEKAKDYAKRHDIEKVYTTVDELMNDCEVDAVYIAVPPKYHKDYAMLSLKHGKVPYVEKPLALNYEEGKEIMEYAKEVNLPVYVAFYRRAMEKYKFIKSLLDKNKLGNINSIQLWQFMKVEDAELNRKNLHWRLEPEVTLGGKFVDMVTHTIDLVQFFFGDIQDVFGFATNKGDYYEVEDTVAAVYRFKNGILGTGNWCYVAGHDDEKMVIIGDKGMIKTTGLFSGNVTVSIGGEQEIYYFDEPEHVAQPYIQQIVNELLEKEKSNADAKSALNNLKIVDEILKEYREENY